MKSSFNIAKINLSLNDIKVLLSSGKKIKLSKSSVLKVKKSRDFLSKKVMKDEIPIYGVNTGFGSLCDKSISLKEIIRFAKKP